LCAQKAKGNEANHAFSATASGDEDEAREAESAEGKD